MLKLDQFVTFFFDGSKRKTLSCPDCKSLEVEVKPTDYFIEHRQRGNAIIRLCSLYCKSCNIQYVYGEPHNGKNTHG